MGVFPENKGGIKVHTLYDIKTGIPTFFWIMPAKTHDTKAMDSVLSNAIRYMNWMAQVNRVCFNC